MAIAAQESLRGAVPDEVIDVALDSLRRHLAALEAETPRRRQATVLFADVSGFTAMSERLDAELVADIMNDIWARLDRVIADHGGRIDKHIGDAVMAVWGGEAAREDDPERAVRAGLALQDALAAFCSETGSRVAMRVGISTGPVLLGPVGTSSESTVMGDTVNVASRVEHHAPIGGVLVTHDTYRTVRGVFEVRALEPFEAKGKAEPVAVYLVERAKPRAFRMAARGVEGVETRTIGRDRELAVLRDAFAEVVRDRAARLVTVVGEAGVGKSRLLYDFLNWLELEPTEVYFFTGRALPTRQTTALGLFRDVVGTRFGILDSDAPDMVADKLRQGLSDSLTPDEADLVGHWLGFDRSSSPAVQRLLGAQLSTTAQAHLVAFFDSLIARRPTVIVLEDLHWADDESLALAAQLVTRLAGSQLLVLGLTRPSLFEQHPDWVAPSAAAASVDVAPLSRDETRVLIGEVLKRTGAVPNDLVELIVARADGNPFYVEELIKMLIDDGVIEPATHGEAWAVDLTRLDPARVPLTLTGVLQARLDSLATGGRQALQCASVIGRVFWDAAVSALARSGSGPSAEAVGDALEETRRRELMYRRDGSSFENTTEYIFKHALLRDVVYETVLLRERQMLHARAAAWIEAHAGVRVGEYREVIAAHHIRAGDHRAAAEHLAHAGHAQLRSGSPLAARRSLERAVGLWTTVGVEPPADALVALGDACRRLGDLDAAETALGAAIRVATTISCRADALYFSSLVASYRGDLAHEEELLAQAVPLAERAGGATLSRTLTGLARSEAQRGDLDGAARHATRALQLAQVLDDPGLICRALDALTVVAGERDDLDQAQFYAESQLAWAETSGNLEDQAHAHATLGVVIHLRGDAGGHTDHYRAAADHYSRALHLYRRLGHRVSQAVATANLAQASLRLGDYATAHASIREVLAEAIEVGAIQQVLLCVQVEADLRICRGDTDSGLALLGMVEAHPSFGSIDRSESERLLSRIALSPDEIEAGLAAGRALDFDTVLQGLLDRAASATRTARGYGPVHDERGDPGAGAAHL